jgi:hypothetical protein
MLIFCFSLCIYIHCILVPPIIIYLLKGTYIISYISTYYLLIYLQFVYLSISVFIWLFSLSNNFSSYFVPALSSPVLSVVVSLCIFTSVYIYFSPRRGSAVGIVIVDVLDDRGRQSSSPGRVNSFPHAMQTSYAPPPPSFPSIG